MSGDLSTGPGLPTPGHAEFEELAVGHALDALEPFDEARLLEHLPSCSRCRLALGEHREVAAWLAYAVDPVEEPALPPLLAEVIAAAASTMPADPFALHPPVPSAAQPRADSADSADSDDSADRASAAAADERDVPAGHVTPVRRPAGRMRIALVGGHRPSRLLAGAALALAVLLTGVVVGVRASNPSTVTQNADPAQLALEAVAQPGAVISKLGHTDGHAGSGAAVLAAGHTVLVVDGLAPNQPAKAHYVVWLVTGADTKRALRSFDVHASGAVPVDLGRASTVEEAGTPRFAVTLERGPATAVLPTVPGEGVLLPTPALPS